MLSLGPQHSFPLEESFSYVTSRNAEPSLKQRYEGVREGAILRQYPLAGHPLDRRETISLVVAARPDPDDFFDGGLDDDLADDLDDDPLASPDAG